MTIPIVHDPPGGMSGKTYEYTLPISKSDVLAEHVTLLTPWFDRFLDKSPSEIKGLLSADWKGFSESGAVVFRDYLLTLSPKSIVIDGEKIWLTLHSAGNTIMIHEPRNLSLVDLDFIRGFNVPSLEIFCSHFFEAHEDVTPYSSAMSMRMEPISKEQFARSGDWFGGMCLYDIGNGDEVMLAPDGKIGRWYHEIGWNHSMVSNRSCAVEQCFDSFEQFVVKYVEYAHMNGVERKATVFW